jgi:hypothetical protein
VQGVLKVPKPAIYLLGSNHLSWYKYAAKKLENRCGTVFYGAKTNGYSSTRIYVRWVMNFLFQSDMIVLWIDDTDNWTQLEFGYCLGLKKQLVVGLDPSLPDVFKHAIEATLEELGHQFPPHESLDQTIEAASWKSRTE